MNTTYSDTPSSHTLSLAIEGMTCASCVGRVERTLKAVPGVTEANVNLATERANVTIGAGAATANLIKAIQDAGYKAREIGQDSTTNAATAERRDAQTNTLRRDLLIAAVLTAPVFILEMGSHLIPGVHQLIANTIGTQVNWWLQFALTTIVLFGPGLRFYAKGIPTLLRLEPEMNSLVAVGTLAAYGFSIVATFAPGLLPKNTVNVYYEAAAVIVTLIQVGS